MEYVDNPVCYNRKVADNDQNMNKTLALIILLLIVIGGIYMAVKSNGGEDELETRNDSEEVAGGQTVTNEQATSTAPETESYTLAEVAEHATAADCWLVIEGKVYDVTPFVSSGRHPGGAAILQGCGKDATGLFNTRPMGSGTPHSDRARSGLENFFIGDLAAE